MNCRGDANQVAAVGGVHSVHQIVHIVRGLEICVLRRRARNFACDLQSSQVSYQFDDFFWGDIETRREFFDSPPDGSAVPQQNQSLKMRHAVNVVLNKLVSVQCLLSLRLS